MITKIVCDKEYARSFRKELNEIRFEKLWKRIVSCGEQFYYKQYKPHISDILKLIPSYSGFEWNSFAPEELPIYLVDKEGPSISNPLTLKIRQNLEQMLTILIHEMTHINMPSKVINDKMFYEDVINQITTKICGNLSIYCGTEVIATYRQEKAKEGLIFENLPLDKKTVKKFLMSH